MPLLPLPLLVAAIISICIATTSAQWCNTLLMAGSVYQANKQGLFHLQPSLYSNRPVYKHQCLDLYLYHVARVPNDNFWIVGPEVGKNAGFSMSRDPAVEPLGVGVGWRSWREDLRVWLDDDDVTLSCQEPCSSLIVGGRFEGVYELLNYTIGGRAAYYSQATLLYLRYSAGDFTCPRWVFSLADKDGGGTEAVSAFIFSSAVSIAPTALRWNVNVPTSQTEKISVTCVDGTGVVDRQCGERMIDDLVGPLLLYGTDAYYGKWPFAASLLREDGVHKCGMTLISDRYLVSSAHCFQDWTSDSTETIIIGATDLDNLEATAKEFSIEAVHLHPNFTWTSSPFEISDDVAVVKLSESVEFSQHVQPACLPPSTNEPLSIYSVQEGEDTASNYEDCHVIGWGRSFYNGPVGGPLQDIPIQTMYPMQLCGDAFYTAYKRWMPLFHGVCVMPEGFGKMCQGDSGSPLLCKSKSTGNWHVMGIASWAFITCLEANAPSVYALTDKYTDWINNITS